LAVLFLIVRIATQGAFTWGGLTAAYQDTPQFILLAVAGAGSLLFVARALRARRVDPWSMIWAFMVVIVGTGLWLLGHDSAPVIIVLGVLGGLLALYGSESPGPA
jgi:uncharacterized membrane protein (UPF0136 family)